MMMAPEVCFFKDFDSFTLESDYLEIVYGSKPFGFGHVTNPADRRFFTKYLGRIEITLPEMLLQYVDQAGFDTAYLVNLCAVFEDSLKFGSFVEKLTRVAGYHQVQLPDCELSTNTTSDSESEDESDIDENMKSRSEKEMELPLIKFTEQQALQYVFTPTYFEVYVPETHAHWRFLHAAIRDREFSLNTRGHSPKPDRSRFLLYSVMLQARKTAARARRAQYVDMGPCNVEFDIANINRSNLTRHVDDIVYRYRAL